MHWTDFHWMLRILAGRSDAMAWTATALLLLVGGVAPEASGQSAPNDSNRVEIRIHGAAVQSARLTAERGTLAVFLPSGGTPVQRLPAGETATLGRRQNDVYFRRGEGGLYAQSLRLVPLREARWTLDVSADSTRTYSGGLSLTPEPSGTGVQFVNRVPLSDYVASVVAGEYGLGDRAGAKAMAVVARTYALFSSTHPEADYDHVDGTASQLYQGVDVITDAARGATRQTQGEILTYEGAPIQAVHFASSGGHTANNEDVWTDSAPLPYLRGKKDPYDRGSPHHRWTVRVNRRALLRTLTLHQDASIEGFLLGDRSPDGRLATIELLLSNGPRAEIEASTFRTVVNEGVKGAPLKSTWFDARREDSEYVFEGRGYGHGVGLNQWGAHAMAQQGKSYREILSFYYTGVKIQERPALRPASLHPPVADEATTARPDSVECDSTSRRVGW